MSYIYDISRLRVKEELSIISIYFGISVHLSYLVNKANLVQNFS